MLTDGSVGKNVLAELVTTHHSLKEGAKVPSCKILLR